MIRKSPKDFIPQITKMLNEDPPCNGYVITEKEVKMVLTYWLKNYAKVLKKYNCHLKIQPYFWNAPTIREVARIQQEKEWNEKRFR